MPTKQACLSAQLSSWTWKLYIRLGSSPGTQLIHADPHVTAALWGVSSTSKVSWLYSQRLHIDVLSYSQKPPPLALGVLKF